MAGAQAEEGGPGPGDSRGGTRRGRGQEAARPRGARARSHHAPEVVQEGREDLPADGHGALFSGAVATLPAESIV